jgi:hypothetical protein
VHIPLKWGIDSGDVGQRRSEATLVTAMISEVPYLRQGFVVSEVKQHHFVSIISFLRGCIPFAVGHDSAGKWGTIPVKIGSSDRD